MGGMLGKWLLCHFSWYALPPYTATWNFSSTSILDYIHNCFAKVYWMSKITGIPLLLCFSQELTCRLQLWMIEMNGCIEPQNCAPQYQNTT